MHMPFTEHGWEPDPELLRTLTDKAAVRLKGDPRTPPRDIIQAVVRNGAPHDVRQEYVRAVAVALQERSQERRPPPSREHKPILEPRPPERQLGFGFGERKKGEREIRPPTRRHL